MIFEGKIKPWGISHGAQLVSCDRIVCIHVPSFISSIVSEYKFVMNGSE